MQITSAVFWDIAQRRMLIPYRRFGTTYRYQSLLMTNLTHFFLSLFITPLYMFRAS